MVAATITRIGWGSFHENVPLVYSILRGLSVVEDSNMGGEKRGICGAESLEEKKK